MSRMIAMVSSMVMVLFMAGCATSFGAKGQTTDELNEKVAALESQVGSLSQRVDELSSQRQQASAESTASVKVASAQSSTANGGALSTKQIQQALKSAGFYNGQVDGKSGSQTKQALKDFQKAQGLEADGVVGSRTRTALAKFLE